jgi:uncharacterized protein (DUF488 family)
MKLYTIGHSTRPLQEFLEMLGAHSVQLLVDVRTVPRSRHNPQYNSANLAASLEQAKLHYRHMAGLGGLRHPRKGATENLGWRNLSFRGYADFMRTPEFTQHLEELIALASTAQTAIMCAEAVPWRCHRSLIADALLVRGIEVYEISSATRAAPLAMHAWAIVEGTRVTYPAAERNLPFTD